MKNIAMTIIASLSMTVVQVYAGNGDLIVNGKTSIGTATAISPLTVGNPIYSVSFPDLAGSQVNIADQPTALTGTSTTIHLINQPNISADSAALFMPFYSEMYIPATSTAKFGVLNGIRSRIDNKGSGTVTNEMGVGGLSYNSSTAGTVTNQSGIFGGGYNISTGTVANQYGVRGFSQNNGGGLVSNQYAVQGTANNLNSSLMTYQYGLHGVASNAGTGTVSNSYGMFTNVSNSSTGGIISAYGLAIGDSTTAGISNQSGTITTGYGLYLGAIQASNKWAIYSNDATAPIYLAGNVGIGTMPSTYELDVNGTIHANSVSPSDLRLKEQIQIIDSALDKLTGINGVSFAWRQSEFAGRNFPGGKHFGVIAQEIEKTLPEVVQTDSNGEKSVAYTEIIPVLIEAIKEQQKIILKQQEELKEIRALILK